MTYNPKELRGKAGKWTRFPVIHASDLSTPDARRSPEVSVDEFQKYAKRGKAKMAALVGKSSEPTALSGDSGRKINRDAFEATRKPWGGVTVDAHTGEHVADDADSYALTVRDPGMESVHVSPSANRAVFNAAMSEAKKRYHDILSRPNHHIGVFRDEDTGTIDIDPVLVTSSLDDVHDIGAFTHAVGGAYHFQSGNGFWPPHVPDVESKHGTTSKRTGHRDGADLSTVSEVSTVGRVRAGSRATRSAGVVQGVSSGVSPAPLYRLREVNLSTSDPVQAVPGGAQEVAGTTGRRGLSATQGARQDGARAPRGHGEDARSRSSAGRDRAPQERRPLGQSAREPRTVEHVPAAGAEGRGQDTVVSRVSGAVRRPRPVVADRKEKDMARSILTPSVHDGADIELAHSDGKLAFWKQILPEDTIHYTAKDGSRQTLTFDKNYLTDLATSQAVDKIPFVLADKDNAHTMDPERFRGEVVELAVREDQPNPKHNGLWGKIVFPNAEMARAVLANPDLGVSARIRENVGRSDGSTVSRGLIHVLGTMDPQASGMAGWQATDLSVEDDNVLDLTNEKFEEKTMAKKASEKRALSDYTLEEIRGMSEEDLDAFLEEFNDSLEDYDESDKGAESEEDEEPEEDEEDDEEPAGKSKSKEPEMALSNKVTRDIELANQRAERADARVARVERELAEAKWTKVRDDYLSAGVPPYLLDLAMPVLNRPDDMVIDLSNSGVEEDDLNVSTVVKGLLDACKGIVDLSAPVGHGGTATNGEDPDKDLLDAWTIEG